VVEVLEDSPGVVNDLVAVHEHRHTALAGQLSDLSAMASALGNALCLVLDAELAQASLDSTARA
jgi:hypothetical protein